MSSSDFTDDAFAQKKLSDESLLDEFEAIWLAGSPPDINTFLACHGELANDADELLVELVRIDLEYRFRSSEVLAKPLAAYLAEYPSLILTADLIEDEWRLRQRFGEPLSEEQWRAAYPANRFPSPDAHADFLRRLQDWLTADRAESSTLPIQSSVLLDSVREDEGPHLVDEDPMMTVVRATESTIADEIAADSWVGLRSRFQREKLLGEGSFGVVWKAYDQQLRRSVAIKTLHPQLARNLAHRDAMIDEARSAAALDHPDLMTIYDVIVEGEQVHLVMRLVDGQPMDVWWRETAQRSEVREDRIMAGVMARISRAVHHAHLSGLIHCDLKPQNVLIDARGNPTILDFGLAIRRSQQEELEGRVFGTPAYMSPEQSFGETHHLDGRSDVWSLGVMLYKLATGQLPFQGSSTSRVLEAIQTRSVMPPGQLRDDIPPELARICMRCLSKRIEDRYATAAELAGDLQRFADEALNSNLLSTRSAGGGRLLGCPWSEPDLVGRDDAIESAVNWLSDVNHRLLTLTGMGGIGKTQTAAVIAKQLAPKLQGDIYWVDAATAMDADQLAASVLSSLGMAQTPEESSRRRVAQIIAVRGPVTLVLDNVEQIVRTTAEQISDWLSRNAALQLIVTSHLPLRIHGERVLQLEPLSIEGSELAVELFIRRVNAVRSDLVISTSMRKDIIEICRLVDGNPLAIELAAARVGVLTIPTLRQRLSQSFGVLKSNRVDRPNRHRTLSNVVRWSVDLLGNRQRGTLWALAIWPAPVSMQIAESLISALGEVDGDSETYDEEPLDWIDELRERQLLRLREDDETMHIHADNTVRRYVLESIQQSERDRIAAAMLDQLLTAPTPASPIDARHFATNLWATATWLMTEAIMVSNDATSIELRQKCVRAILVADRLVADQVDSRLRIERIETGLALSSGKDRIEMMVRLADAKRLAGETEQAETLCRELLEIFATANADNTASAMQMFAWEVDTRCLLAQLLFRHSRSAEAVGLLQSILDSANDVRLNNAERIAVMLDLIEYQRRLGHLSKAMELLTQAQSLGTVGLSASIESGGDGDGAIKQLLPGLTVQEGKIALQRGRIAEARNLFDQALGQQTRAAKSADPRHLQQALLGRAAAAAESGDYESAEQDYDRCQRISRRLGDLPTLAQSLNNRALAADDAGDSQKCCEILTQALEIYQQLDDSVGISICLAARAASLLQLGRFSESVELLTSLEVTKHLPPESLHQAIVWGDLGTAYHRLGKLDQARVCLDDCLNKLDELSVGATAERLLYELERCFVRRDLAKQDSDDVSDDKHLAGLIEYWEAQPSRRARVDQAIGVFRQQNGADLT
jgi:serine/threonine protein kinase/predicted ATPase